MTEGHSETRCQGSVSRGHGSAVTHFSERAQVTVDARPLTLKSLSLCVSLIRSLKGDHVMNGNFL